jgi:exopolyphosphatase/pppGpp-phosphohydrolase
VAAEREIDEARVRLLFAAACVFEAVLAAFAVARMLVSEAGIKEGLLLEAAA